MITPVSSQTDLTTQLAQRQVAQAQAVAPLSQDSSRQTPVASPGKPERPSARLAPSGQAGSQSQGFAPVATPTATVSGQLLGAAGAGSLAALAALAAPPPSASQGLGSNTQDLDSAVPATAATTSVAHNSDGTSAGSAGQNTGATASQQMAQAANAYAAPFLRGQAAGRQAGITA